VALEEAQVDPGYEAALRQHDDVGERGKAEQVEEAAEQDEETRQMVLFEADEALVDDHCVGHDLLYGDDEAAQKATQAVHSGVE